MAITVLGLVVTVIGLFIAVVELRQRVDRLEKVVGVRRLERESREQDHRH